MTRPRMTYVLQFNRPPGHDKSAPEPPTTATELTVTTQVKGEELHWELIPGASDAASLTLSFRLDCDNVHFIEWGTVTFADEAASSLTFHSIDRGYLDPVADPDGFSHGTVSYRIISATGKLTGATGAITSNFLVNLETNELIDTHLGVVLLP